tara:strand:- start:604 stop:1005 length:402 start_codon:yes stop_codon:yes gene_type:complete
MDRKKKIILVVAILAAAGGIFFYLNKKKKGEAKQALGAPDTGGGTGFDSKACQEVEEATGGGKGVYLAIKGKKGSAARKLANDRYKKGMFVSVDGGKPTKIIKIWRDSNRDIGALKLENKVAKGNVVCILNDQ